MRGEDGWARVQFWYGGGKLICDGGGYTVFSTCKASRVRDCPVLGIFNDGVLELAVVPVYSLRRLPNMEGDGLLYTG